MSVPVVIIAAVARNRAIGLRNKLPWRLPTDLRRFKSDTMGKPVLMGRKTFTSIARPLSGRHVVVVSRNPALSLPAGVICASSVESALERAQMIAVAHGATEVMVAGGAEIYGVAIGFSDILRITEVDLTPEADSFFPEIDPDRWKETSREPQFRGEHDEAAHAIIEYRHGSGFQPATPDRA